MIVASVCSLIVIGVFLRMSFSYTSKRKNRVYSIGKQAAPSIGVFKNLSKFLFVSSMLLTLLSYWLPLKLLIQIPPSDFQQVIGALIVAYGSYRLARVFSILGNNYSPVFDAYQPFELITQGPYRIIRHPIYLYNLFVSFGLAISSGSGLVAINAITGLIFILKAIKLEEKYLTDIFSDYADYKKHSWRLIPGVF